MIDYLQIAYKDSDYTVIIALICWPKCIFWVLKITGVKSAFIFM